MSGASPSPVASLTAAATHARRTDGHPCEQLAVMAAAAAAAGDNATRAVDAKRAPPAAVTSGDDSPADMDDMASGDDDDEAYEEEGVDEDEDYEETSTPARATRGVAQDGASRKRKRVAVAGSASSHSIDAAEHSHEDGNDANGGQNRTARACSWCRRRKRKCDGAKPTCVWCAKGGLACNYPSALLKRGPQSGMMKKLKKKVEELEQQLSTVRVLPRSMVGGLDVPSTLSITSFLQRIRGAKQFHLAASAATMGGTLSHAQLHALTPQTAQTHAALRDRLYLASFLASFNVVFPVLNAGWESTYLRVLDDDVGSVTPPMYWMFQYSSAIAMGALMHQDLAYANESASVARHAASALFDEAHTEVLRGLLLLSCLLLGLGQSARASCYIAVANRMVYLLSRPPCIDVRVANSSHHLTSELAFPGTFPESAVPLALPPKPATESSVVPVELKLLYSLVEDLSSATLTVKGLTQVGWDPVEKIILDKKKKQLALAQSGASAEANNASSTTGTDTPPSVVTLAPFVANTSTNTSSSNGGAATAGTTAAPTHTPYHSLSNDHMLTLGLECRHSSPDVFTECLAEVNAWRTTPASLSSDLTPATLAVLRMFVFLTSFRGELLQLVRPTTNADGEILPCPSRAQSLDTFLISLANTRAALVLCNKLIDALTALAATSPSNNSARSKQAVSGGALPKLHLLLLTQPSSASGIQHHPPVLLLQSGESQLHALTLFLKAIFMHMLLLEGESHPDTLAKNTPDSLSRSLPTADDDARLASSRTPSIRPPSAVASPRLHWPAVILASNTATSFTDSHGLDLSYCAFYCLLLHLNIQIKLKYVKQCMAGWKRSQKWQMQVMIRQGSPPAPKSTLSDNNNNNNNNNNNTAATTTAQSPADDVPPSGVSALPVATHTLLDSLHYLHIDFSLLESMNQRWTTFSEAIWRDAQERITELLHYLQMPVGAMSGVASSQLSAAAAASGGSPSVAAGSSPTSTGSATTPREAAVMSVLLEDALGVYDSIMSKFALFNTTGQTKKEAAAAHPPPTAATAPSPNANTRSVRSAAAPVAAAKSVNSPQAVAPRTIQSTNNAPNNVAATVPSGAVVAPRPPMLQYTQSNSALPYHLQTPTPSAGAMYPNAYGGAPGLMPSPINMPMYGIGGGGGMQLANPMTPSGILYPTYQQAAAFQQQQQQMAQQQQHAYYYQQLSHQQQAQQQQQQQQQQQYSPTGQLGVLPSFPVGASMLTNNQLHGLGLKPIVNNPAGALPGGWIAMQTNHTQPQAQTQAQTQSLAVGPVGPITVKTQEDEAAGNGGGGSGSVGHGLAQLQHPSLMPRTPFVQQAQQLAGAQLQYPFYSHPMAYSNLSPTGTGATAANAAAYASYPIAIPMQQQQQQQQAAHVHAPIPTAGAVSQQAQQQPPPTQAQA